MHSTQPRAQTWQRIPLKQINPQSKLIPDDLFCARCEFSFPTSYHLDLSCECGSHKVSHFKLNFEKDLSKLCGTI